MKPSLMTEVVKYCTHSEILLSSTITSFFITGQLVTDINNLGIRLNDRLAA